MFAEKMRPAVMVLHGPQASNRTAAHLGVLLQEVDDSWRHPGHLAGEEGKGVAVAGEPPSAPHPARGPAGQQQGRAQVRTGLWQVW